MARRRAPAPPGGSRLPVPRRVSWSQPAPLTLPDLQTPVADQRCERVCIEARLGVKHRAHGVSSSGKCSAACSRRASRTNARSGAEAIREVRAAPAGDRSRARDRPPHCEPLEQQLGRGLPGVPRSRPPWRTCAYSDRAAGVSDPRRISAFPSRSMYSAVGALSCSLLDASARSRCRWRRPTRSGPSRVRSAPTRRARADWRRRRRPAWHDLTRRRSGPVRPACGSTPWPDRHPGRTPDAEPWVRP